MFSFMFVEGWFLMTSRSVPEAIAVCSKMRYLRSSGDHDHRLLRSRLKVVLYDNLSGQPFESVVEVERVRLSQCYLCYEL